jgi:hypothetical protein
MQKGHLTLKKVFTTNLGKVKLLKKERKIGHNFS